MATVYSPPSFLSRPPQQTLCLPHRRKPNGVLKARLKHNQVQNDHKHTVESAPNPRRATFYDRFFSLPSELRMHIYRHLLVQPCKFDMEHKQSCTTLPHPRPGPCPYDSWKYDLLCAECARGRWNRESQLHVFTSPARSQWAKPPRNAYLCDNCYWDKYGYQDMNPCMRTLRCLCTRRQNLDILLVSKRIYNEAASVFWTENCFAFELPCLLNGFLSSIRPEIKSQVRRICFMPLHDGIFYKHDYGTNFRPFREINKSWEGWSDVTNCWRLLRQCDGLTELELDVFFLSRLDWALSLRTIRVKRRVTFSRHPQPDETELHRMNNAGARIWVSHVARKPVNTALTRLLASSMMRPRAMKSKALKYHFFEEATLHERYGGNIYPDLHT